MKEMSKKTFWSKCICMTIVLVMLLGALAGCGGNDKPEETPTSSTPPAVESSEPTPPTEGGKPENYPTKPIEIIVPYSAGGAADIVARAIASVLPDYLDGTAVTITNVSGGNGVVGVTQLISTKNDGYTISIYASPVFEITPFMNDVTYKMDDFTFLGTVVQRPNVLVVHADSPWQTLEEFVEHAKANPGTTYGDPAAGSAHLGFEALITAAELTDMKFIPYSGGSGEAITALLGKHVDAVMALPADTYEYIRAGNLRALCIQGDERIDIMPDVPTAKESGYDVVVGLTNGFIAPAGLDPEIAAYLTNALEQAVNDPRVLELDPGDEGLLIFYNGEDTKQLLADTALTFEVLINDLGLAG